MDSWIFCLNFLNCGNFMKFHHFFDWLVIIPRNSLFTICAKTSLSLVEGGLQGNEARNAELISKEGRLYISYIGSTDFNIWHFICMDLYRTSIVSWSMETKYAVYKLKKFQMWQVPEFWQNVMYCLLYILYCHQGVVVVVGGSVSQLWEIGGKIGEIFQPVPSPSPR